MEQDGNVCDKRNSSDFIVPPRHTTNVRFETWSNVETQDGVYREKRCNKEKVDVGKKRSLSAIVSITEVKGPPSLV